MPSKSQLCANSGHFLSSPSTSFQECDEIAVRETEIDTLVVIRR
jgi:hypothetical protein